MKQSLTGPVLPAIPGAEQAAAALRHSRTSHETAGRVVERTSASSPAGGAPDDDALSPALAGASFTGL